jgi:hypothetical protein
MGWYIEVTDFHFDIRVDKDGLSVSGQGNQVFRSSVDPLEIKMDMTEIKTLPASWSITEPRRLLNWQVHSVSMCGK